ncbi:RING-type domain-containing protein [Mycena chlorophos]|uniref:RING-type domain-containing protein n=1 Tax=Mycena chlorophos TaxID=658473 RepID=A0A8H6SWZ1_MYCCL|nr:RING-type domain-containing protein [Mycena chlorophos]
MSSSGEGSGARSSPRGVKRTNAAVVPRKRQKIEESEDDIEEFPDNLTQATPPPTTQTQSTLKDEELSLAGPAPKLETEPIVITPLGILMSDLLLRANKRDDDATMIQRGAMIPGSGEARCPVCRAEIPGWDGRGGGVIGLQMRFVVNV